MATEYEHTIRHLPMGENIKREDFADSKIWLAKNPSLLGWANLEIEVVPYAKDKEWRLVCKTGQTGERLFAFLMHKNYLKRRYHRTDKDMAPVMPQRTPPRSAKTLEFT